MCVRLYLLFIVAAIGMAAFIPVSWALKEGCQSGQQALLTSSDGTRSGSADVLFSKALGRSPRAVLGITRLESASGSSFAFNVSLTKVQVGSITVAYSIGSQTSISVLWVSYLAVDSLMEGVWVTGPQQMEALTSLAPIASGGGVRSVSVTFDYTALTGKNTSSGSKVLLFTLGLNVTTASDLGYSVGTSFINAQSYSISLTVQNNCSIDSFSFNTVLLDQILLESSYLTYVDSGQVIASSGNWDALSISLQAVFTESTITGLKDFSYSGLASPSFSLKVSPNNLLGFGNTSFSALSFVYISIRQRSCPSSYPYFDPSDNLCYDACSAGKQSNTEYDICQPCNCSSATRNVTQCPCDEIRVGAGCHYTCKTCSSSTATSCKSCYSTTMRTFQSSNTSCPCNTGFFDNGISTCVACSYTCLTCNSITATGCLTCSAEHNRTFFSANNSCPCDSGYYDNMGSACVACSIGCITCQSGTSCLLCDATAGFVLSDNVCVSQIGTGVTPKVSGTACTNQVENCAECTVFSKIMTCTGCFNGFWLNHEKTFWNGWGYVSIYSCLSCASSMTGCLKCSNSTNCSSCNSFTNFTENGSTCACKNGTYLNGSSCSLCSSTLANCQSCLSKTVCTVCSKGFTVNVSNCVSCGSSMSGCLSCSNLSMCTICNAATYFTLSGSTCICASGYYLNAGSCLPCSSVMAGCATCTNQNCTSCSKGYVMNTYNECIFSCFSTPGCINCSSTQCSSCNISANFLLSGSVCVCSIGYYLSTNVCALCASSIEHCTQCGSPTNCFACASGYYLSSDNTSCLSCSSAIAGCAVCATSSQCSSCLADSYALSGSTCICSGSSYRAADGSCSSCHYSCLTCNDTTSNNCLTCGNQTIRQLVNGSCLCLQGYNDTGSAVCQCPTGFFISSSGCEEVCGDGLLFVLGCDDNNTISGDGCSSNCTLEPNYECANGSSTTPSICSYELPISVTLQNVIKNTTSNTVYLSFSLLPTVQALNLLNFSGSFSCSLSSVQLSSFTYDQNGGLIIEATYNESIQGSGIDLVFSPSVKSAYFFATPSTSVSFAVDPSNNIAADAYGDDYYSGVKAMQIIVILVMSLYLVSFVASLFTVKYIGVEMMGVIQIAFIGLSIINYLPPLISPFQTMSYVNGVNTANITSGSLASMPHRISSLNYGASLKESFNYSTILLALPLIASLVFSAIAKRNMNDPIKKTKYGTLSKTTLCEWGLTAVMFTLYHSVASIVLFMMYGGSVETVDLSVSVVEAIFIVGVIAGIAALFHLKGRHFGDYKKAFKPDSLSQAHYWLLIGARVLVAALLVGANTFDQIGYVSMLIPLASLVYIAVRRPYLLLYNNIRAIVNESVMLAILCIYGYYRSAVEHSMHKEPVITTLAWIEIVLLLLVVVLNSTIMVKYQCNIRKQQADNARQEEAAKVVKLEEKENNQFMEETKVRLHALVGGCSNISPVRLSTRNKFESVRNFFPEKMRLSVDEGVVNSSVEMKGAREETLLSKKVVKTTTIEDQYTAEQVIEQVRNEEEQI